MVAEKAQIILGIDPGSNFMGYGVIRVEGKNTSIVSMGVLAPGKFKTHYEKLKYLFDRVMQVIEQYQPDEMALEAPFFGKNVQSMLKLGRAQGVAMSAALYHNLPIFEYAPLKVKQSITGMGRASKEQVAYFLQKMYGLTEVPTELDATDAIAVAVCHVIQKSNPVSQKAYSGWGDYIRKNPGRVK